MALTRKEKEMKKGNDIFGYAKRLNKNYKKIIKYLAKQGIDFTLSPSLNWVSDSRSIYITQRKFIDYNMQLRISDHSTEGKEKAIEDFCVYVDYNKKINMKEFKIELMKKAQILEDKFQELSLRNKNEQKIKQKTKKYKDLVNTIKLEQGKRKYTNLIRSHEFGLSTTNERITILLNEIKKGRKDDKL